MAEDKVKEMEEGVSEESKVALLAARWKNRRKMAYVSILMMVMMTVSLFFFIPEGKLDKLQDVISWAYMSFASIVGAYMGLSTYADKKK